MPRQMTITLDDATANLVETLLAKPGGRFGDFADFSVSYLSPGAVMGEEQMIRCTQRFFGMSLQLATKTDGLGGSES